jgi:hypothetical protein
MIAWLQYEITSAWRGWNRFWFDSRSDDVLSLLGIYRFLFCSIACFFYLTRHLDLEFFYGESGIMPLSHLKSLPGLEYRPTILSWIPDLLAIQALHLIFLLALSSLALGFFTRASAILAFFLHLNFMNRNPTILFGMDTIGTYFLFYLCFANSGARYSLDSLLRKRSGKAPDTCSHSPTSHIAFRLMQLQVCIVYAYSGLEKLKGMRWWDGSALWDVLSIGNMQRFDMSIVAHFPLLLAGSVYLVLLWEIYFPALIWVPRLRMPMLFFGLVMHIGIVISMNLPSFGFMMIANYILFLKASELDRGMHGIRKALRMA